MNKLILFVFMLSSFSLFAQKKVLLEKITSANCGSCPNASIDIGALVETYPNVIWINHHWWTDQMGNPSSTEIITGMNASGTPQGMIDRITVNDHAIFGLGLFESKIQEQINEPAFCNIDLNAAIDTINGLLDATVNVNFSETPPDGDFRISLIILEDDMTGSGYGWNQSNYYNEVENHPLFGLGQPIRGYKHQNVVRKIFDDPWGAEQIIPSFPQLNTEYTYQVSWEMDELIQNPANIELVAIVNYYGEELTQRKVLNASHLDITGMDFFVGSDDLLPETKFSMYPNPGKDNLNIVLPEGDFIIDLFSIAGTKLQTWHKVNNQAVLPISPYDPGIYFLNIRNENGVLFSRKLIIH